MSKNRPMMRTVSFGQHLLVMFSIGLMALLAGLGVIGAGDEAFIRPEHFDAKQTTVWPDGADGVWIREVVDVDFGLSPRRGYERLIPNDFGVPTDVTAESPNAIAQLDVLVIDDVTRIRIGDPNVTFNGRRRYVLQYRLPAANVGSGRLHLDIIDNDETIETERFEVVLTGFQFESIECSTGSFRTVGGCSFGPDASDNLSAVIEPLAPGAGVTVDGNISALSTPVVAVLPDPVDATPSGFRQFGFIVAALGVAAAALVYLIGRIVGSNDVMAGGAAAAAFGEAPSGGAARRRRDATTSRVADSRLARLATTEFEPPPGLEPWQAAAVLRETVDDHSVAAWFSTMIANGAIVARKDDHKVWLSAGPDTDQLSPADRKHVHRLFAQGELRLGKRNKAFGTTWNRIRNEQRRFAMQAGWWSRGGPGTRTSKPTKLALVAFVVLVVVAEIVALAFVMSLQVFWRVAGSPWFAAIPAVVIPLMVATIAYRPMFASRTAAGSARAIRAESFRRFLVASEGRHVEWAWEQGLVREYSAWAVALGAARAWSKAIEDSNIPDAQVALSGPLLVYTANSDFRSSRTVRSTFREGGSGSYSSGGGGSSGGGSGGSGVGGGGGGGSSGSW